MTTNHSGNVNHRNESAANKWDMCRKYLSKEVVADFQMAILPAASVMMAVLS
jgi:hypothetical protein